MQFLVEKTIDRALPSDNDIRNELGYSEIRPFITPIGAEVNALSAISLLNRYCGALPVDEFTVSAPIWRKTSENGKIAVSIVLPIQSPVREEITVS